jgi:hypothetical protein
MRNGRGIDGEGTLFLELLSLTVKRVIWWQTVVRRLFSFSFFFFFFFSLTFVVRKQKLIQAVTQ